MNKYQKEVIQTQLNNEKDIIKELQETYEKALEDVNEKIRELSARTDLENLQTIIYQTQYQKALKAQIEGRLDQLHADEFGSISKYLGEAYNVGFVGVAYDIANQGIPILMPIDEEAVKKALTVDSKLSSTLYNSLGENVSDLKTAIRQELSRGIVEGKTWNQIAMSIAGNMKNSPFQKAVNNSIRIARTEGHRVSIQGAIDAQHKAKESGADIVKQWDATLDSRTRPLHAALDGQIVEVDEYFEIAGYSVEAPGMFDDPKEDCNCRCALLQRARWALDEEELETLRDRAEQLELYVPEDKREMYREAKEQNFERYKEKYLNIDFKEQSLRTKDGGDYGVNWSVVKSKDYTKKFDNISDNKKANALAAQRSRNALANRNGKKTEELYAINLTTGKDIAKITNQNIDFGINRTEKFDKAIKRIEEKGENVLLIHNHPKGYPPSIVDLNELLNHENTVGITVGHNGSVYYYTRPSQKIPEFDYQVAIRKNKSYNGIELEEKALELLSEKYGFNIKKY